MIGRIWEPLLAHSLGAGREEARRATRGRGGTLVRDAEERRRHPGRVQLPGRIVKFGIFYEHQLPRPWEEDGEYRLLQDAPRAGRTGRPPRLRRRVGGGAPLPGGVQPLLGARGVPRRMQPAHQGHPPRARDHPDRAGLQPPGPHCGARRHLGPALGRTGRVRLGRVGLRGRARRLPGRPGDQARGVARGAPGRAALHDGDPVHRRRRTIRADAAAQRRAQADAEAAPAALGRVLAARHHPARGREGDRRPDLRLHRPRGGGEVGVGLRADAGRALCPGRSGRQPEHRVRHADDVPPRREGCARPRPRGRELLRVLARALLRLRRAPAGFDRRVARVPRPARRVRATRPRSRRRCARSASGPSSPPATAPACAVRRARRRRCASTSSASSRPASTRSSSCCRPGKNRHEHICESLELFGREVLPAFKERDEAQVQAKAARLAPAVEAALARRAPTSPTPPALPSDYSFPGHARAAGPTRRAARRCASGSSSSPTPGPRASATRGSGILGD